MLAKRSRGSGQDMPPRWEILTRDTPKCAYCGRYGHVEGACYTKQKNKAKKKREEKACRSQALPKREAFKYEEGKKAM